jgi:hypothetical protein
MLQFGASLTDNASSVNYDQNMFIIKATGHRIQSLLNSSVFKVALYRPLQELSKVLFHCKGFFSQKILVTTRLKTIGKSHGQTSGANVIKPFTPVSYKCCNKLECLFLESLSSLVYCLWTRLGVYHRRYFTWVGSCLTHKDYTFLERLARDKRSSLLENICNLRP